MTALKLFGKTCSTKDAVERVMCVNIRQSSATGESSERKESRRGSKS